MSARSKAAAYAAEIPDAGRRKLIEAAHKLRDAKLDVEALEERLAAAKAEVSRLSEQEVLDLLDSMGTDHFGIPPDGNLPGYDMTSGYFYEGGIAASWPLEKQEEGFKTLEEYGHGGLIKTLVTVQVPRGKTSQKVVEALEKTANRYALDAEIKKGVHSSTFRSWLRSEHEAGHKLPPLDKIGAFIRRRVNLKERRG